MNRCATRFYVYFGLTLGHAILLGVFIATRAPWAVMLQGLIAGWFVCVTCEKFRKAAAAGGGGSDANWGSPQRRDATSWR